MTFREAYLDSTHQPTPGDELPGSQTAAGGVNEWRDSCVPQLAGLKRLELRNDAGSGSREPARPGVLQVRNSNVQRTFSRGLLRRHDKFSSDLVQVGDQCFGPD